MKITFFISSLYGGGAERVTCNLASYFAKEGHEVEILTVSNQEPFYEIDNKVKHFSLSGEKFQKTKIIKNIIRFFRFFYFILKKKTDIYIVMLPIPTIMLLSVKRFLKSKVIASERANPERYSNRIIKLLKKLCNNADGYVFQTEDAKLWYESLNLQAKNVIIPNAINDEFLKIKRSNQLEKSIVSAGRLQEQKNFQLLIKSFSRIEKDFPDYKLIIYGEGSLKNDLVELTNKLNIKDKVIFPGYVKDIGEAIKDARIFVLSSNYEGMPNALMEAMTIGIPCISTDCPCGGPRFLIKNMENGILVPMNDVQKLADAMRFLISNENKQEYLGNNAKKIAESLNSNVIYKQWEDFINEILQ